MRSFTAAEDAWLLEHASIIKDRKELADAFAQEHGHEKSRDALRRRLNRLKKNGSLHLLPRKEAAAAFNNVEADRQVAIVLSDIHHGSRVLDQGGKEIYNSSICESRIRSIPEKTLAIAAPGEHKAALVLLVGDIVDGEGVYPSHGAHLEQSVCDQVADSRAALWYALTELCGIYGAVRVCCVVGNHGRANKVIDERSNWDIMLYQQLQLQASISDSRIAVDIGYRDGAIFEHMGHKLYLRHIGIKGDATPSNRGKLGSWLEQYNWDLLVCGHWHMPGLLSYNGRPVLRNGAVQPVTDYGERLGYHDTSKQFVFSMSRNRVIEWLSWVKW